LPRRHLSAFNIFRFGDISGGQFSQRYLRFVVTNILGVPLTFGSLISQMDGAWGHWQILTVGQPHYRKDPNQGWSKQNISRLVLGGLLLSISGKRAAKDDKKKVEKPTHAHARKRA
jgi:hypothetical protein